MNQVVIDIDLHLVNLATVQSAATMRTTEAQIQFWVRLGMIVDSVLSDEILQKMKATAIFPD